MAGRTWLKLVRNAFLAAAVLVAAQVGAAISLGIVDWQQSFDAKNSWGQMLTWVAFVFALSVVGGAAVGQRFVPKRLKPLVSGRRSIAIRMFAAVSAGVGAAATIPLVWMPVRVGEPLVDIHPELTITLTAVAGILVGMILALAALTWGPVAASVFASGGWVWLFALGSTALAAVYHAKVTPRLGLVDAPQLIPASSWWFGPYLMVGVAALLGLMVAAGAGWRGARWHGIALSGIAGPLLVASAYLITGWGVSGNGEDIAPYAASLVSAVVGLVVSAAIAAPQRRLAPVRVPGPPAALAAAPAAPATAPAPLAISSYPSTYVVDNPTAEPAYVREHAFYTPRADYEAVEAPATDVPAHVTPIEATVQESGEPIQAELAAPKPAPAPKRARSSSGRTGRTSRSKTPEKPAPPVVAAPAPSPVPASSGPSSPAGRGSSSGPAPSAPARGRDKSRKGGAPAEGPERPLRKGERDHIDWINNLVNVPADPELRTTKDR